MSKGTNAWPFAPADKPTVQKDNDRTHQAKRSSDSHETTRGRLLTAPKQESGHHTGTTEFAFRMSWGPSWTTE